MEKNVNINSYAMQSCALSTHSICYFCFVFVFFYLTKSVTPTVHVVIGKCMQILQNLVKAAHGMQWKENLMPEGPFFSTK